jgi:hypothetical protein
VPPRSDARFRQPVGIIIRNGLVARDVDYLAVFLQACDFEGRLVDQVRLAKEAGK